MLATTNKTKGVKEANLKKQENWLNFVERRKKEIERVTGLKIFVGRFEEEGKWLGE